MWKAQGLRPLIGLTAPRWHRPTSTGMVGMRPNVQCFATSPAVGTQDRPTIILRGRVLIDWRLQDSLRDRLRSLAGA